jgi:hypothetical protein
MLVIAPRPGAGAGRPCPEDGRKAVAETTSKGGRRVPLPVDGREPLLLQKESAVAAEKTLFPAEKGRLDERLPEWMRWCEMPLPCPSKESVGEERSAGRIGDCGRRVQHPSRNDHVDESKINGSDGAAQNIPKCTSTMRKDEGGTRWKGLPKKEIEDHKPARQNKMDDR